MKVYHDTNTAYCFAGGCDVESVDVIDFIMRMEKGTKRAAILKAKDLCGKSVTIPATLKPAAPKLDLRAIYEESIEGMQRTPSGREYCDLRGLDTNGIGYRSRKSKERWGRGCIIFPLVDKGCKIKGLYGRAVKGGGHYYTAERSGLYPEYPEINIQRLLLTESVIDAACINGVLDDFAVLALYGTNGLTASHRLEVKELPELKEVMLALDGDVAGRKATVAIAAELRALRPGLTVTTLELPEGEDINGLWVSYADADGTWLKELFAARKPVGDETLYTGSNEEQAQGEAAGELAVHTHYLEYLGVAARYRVRGGIRGGAESLKVSLQIQAGRAGLPGQGRPVRTQANGEPGRANG